MTVPRHPAWATALLLGLVPGLARAEGYSLDPELVRSSFSFHAMPGLDNPHIAGEAGMRVGTTIQLEQDPLMLYMGDDDQAAIINSRGDVQLGLSYDWNSRLSTRIVVPLAFQGEGEVPSLSAAGFGMRNMSLGGRVGLADTEILTVAARADVGLPTGTRARYMGEAAPRVELGFLVGAELGPVEALIDAGYSGTTVVETEYDLSMGSEAIANVGLRYGLVPDRFALGLAALSRTGAKTTLEPGGARAEGLLVAQAWPVEGIQLDLGVGRGLTAGYGTTGARFLVGFTWIKPAHEPEFIPIEVDDDPNALTLGGRKLEAELPDELPDEDIEWKQGELARVEVHKASYWQIDHLVIEGHASEEGEFQPNFELSIDRARSIYVTLVEKGVHPARISFRGFGEVDPKDTGEDEADLARNRRVEFHIVRQLEALEVPPEYAATVRLPWTGEVVSVRQAQERLLGQEFEVLTPIGPGEDEQALDLIRGMLDEESEEQEQEEPDSKLREYDEELPDFGNLYDDEEQEQPEEDSP